MRNFIAIAKEIYRFHYPPEARRGVVFIVRAYLHYVALNHLCHFFESDASRREVFVHNKFPIEQATRAFFYKDSTLQERIQLIREHFEILEATLRPEIWQGFYTGKRFPIWHFANADAETIHWYAEIAFESGQRKEGLLAVMMHFQGVTLYQIMFWLAYDANGNKSLYIGAMQGPNVTHAKDLIKEATRLAHRYRTKNLILYITQAIARALGVQRIYAVSNAGYYANNHLRRDRKLKTNFGSFWEEIGGRALIQNPNDAYFYELPLTETRKTMEEVPTRKRAVYRRRFLFQDDVDAQVAQNVATWLQ